MIGSIEEDDDIVVFLETDEIIRLNDERLEGVLIRFHKPKQQGKIFISVNDERKNENGYGVGVVREGYSYKLVGVVELFVGGEWYKHLRENGLIGLRYGTIGSKVNIFDRDKQNFSGKNFAEHLEHYRDNRDKLPESFG